MIWQMMVHDTTLISLSQKHVLPGTCLDGNQENQVWESQLLLILTSTFSIKLLMLVEVVLFLETIETDRETIIIEQDNVALKM